MEEFKPRIDLVDIKKATESVKTEIGKYLIGQNAAVEWLLIALLADGHVLLEGVPGVAKTLMAKLLSETVQAKFKRIQFTPDLMPGDITGNQIFNAQISKFEFREGPLFANIVLADEINRAPAKTQSALFEAMEERQITVDGTTHPLGIPFMVLATQNPVEQEGTYRLPEAQLDRFLLKIPIGYPDLTEEHEILKSAHERKNKVDLKTIAKVLTTSHIAILREIVQEVRIEENLLHFIAKIVHETRKFPSIQLGASPRASLAILNASKASAALQGRDFVAPEDIHKVAPPVLVHRIVLTPEKEMEGVSVEDTIQQILEKIEIPR